MILAILICFGLAWGLGFIDRRRARAKQIELGSVAATFSASCFLTLLFALGESIQIAIDYYVAGQLGEFIFDMQTWWPSEVSGFAADRFVVASLVTAPSVVVFHYRSSFFSGILWASLTTLALLVVRFLILYWSQPYIGSFGLAFLCVGIGLPLSAFFTQVLRCEVGRVALNASRKQQRRAIVGISAASTALWVLASFAVYQIAVLPIQKPVDLRFTEWDHLIVTASTHDAVEVAPFHENNRYQPAIPFARGVLEESLMPDFATGQAATRPGRLQFQFARVLRLQSTLRTESMNYVRGGPDPRFAPSSLSVLRFSACTAYDLARLNREMVGGRVGTRTAVASSGTLELEAHRSWIFHPVAAAPGLQLMLPAWDNDIIHVAPVDGGQGVSAGSQAPLNTPARAMISNPSPFHLLILVDREPVLSAHVTVQGSNSRRRVDVANVHRCAAGDSSEPATGGMVLWDRITTDRSARLSGFLAYVGPRAGGQAQLDESYVARVQNPDSPTRFKEGIIVPLDHRNPVTSIFPGARATVVSVGLYGRVGQVTGSFGALSFSMREFSHTLAAGDRLDLAEDRSRAGNLRVSGSARHVSVDEENHYHTFLTALNETALLGIITATFSAFMALLVLLWRRIPIHRRVCAELRSRVRRGMAEGSSDAADRELPA